MREIAHAVDQGMREATATRTVREPSPTTRKLFIVLHGAYGNQLLAKFNTGQLVETEGPDQGKDKGLLAAMAVWDADLSRYEGSVVEAAARRLMARNPDYAPTLPQLVQMCEALTPRKTWAQENRLPALPPPNVIPPKPVEFERHNDNKDWARAILAQVDAGISKSPGVVRAAREALGKEGRKSWQ